jgi:hypothetical protein
MRRKKTTTRAKKRYGELRMATGTRVLRAYARAAKRMLADENGYLRTSETAGYVIPPGQRRGARKGFAVIVAIAKYDEALGETQPGSGGLLELARGRPRKWKVPTFGRGPFKVSAEESPFAPPIGRKRKESNR